jgi:hypothetical protein
MGKTKLDDDVDELFKVPLAEFTGNRNALAARLKKESRAEDAERVKALSKPSVSAWAVNQLYVCVTLKPHSSPARPPISGNHAMLAATR